MTTFDAAVALAEQLSPAEQARLVMLLAERLQQRLSSEEEPAAGVASEPAFWHLADLDAVDGQADTPHVDDVAATEIMLRRWFAQPLSEADALDLAMSESLGEWNLER
jgi:hypothetical protein